MNIVMIGAGSTGRGHLAALLYEAGERNITFVDRDPALITALREAGGYTLRLLGNAPRKLEVMGFKYLHISEREEESKAISEADLLLTSVLGENLPAAAAQIAAGLRARKAAGIEKYLNIVGCENLDRASSVLKKYVYALLTEEEQLYADAWAGFPDAMISRVVPLATGHPLELVAEDYNEWVADKNNFKGEDPGWPFFELTERLEARLERKLWIHNGGHATVAYAAFMRGHTYIHEAVADPEIADFTVKVMRELGDAVIHKHGFDTEEIRAYEDDFGPRGAIVEMMDEVARVVRNPLRKLAKADRLTAPAIYAETHGLSNRYILRSIVNVTLYDAPDDEKAVEMQEYIKKSGFEAFLNEVIGIKEYPEMVKKLVDMRKELVCQSR